nr:MAG TPA: hypothetical protein [Herelleviridae sp.]
MNQHIRNLNVLKTNAISFISLLLCLKNFSFTH